jgi:hypothetical protein
MYKKKTIHLGIYSSFILIASVVVICFLMPYFFDYFLDAHKLVFDNLFSEAKKRPQKITLFLTASGRPPKFRD